MAQSKRANKSAIKRQRRDSEGYEDSALYAVQPMQSRIDSTPITPKTENQRRYINAIKNFVLTFATGPAGSGKTWLCAALAARALVERQIDKIVITRPCVESGEKLGALPGELEDKFDPFLQPFRDVLNERLGKSYVDCLIKSGRIEAAPLAYMRGRTFKNAFVILDEGQNTTPTQMKLFLTRIGENCTVVVNGDVTQKDIHCKSGLDDAIDRLSFIPSIKHVQFDVADIVRSGLVQEVVEAYQLTTEEVQLRKANDNRRVA